MTSTQDGEPQVERIAATGVDRLGAFSDGVFAIAITLLVLPLTEAEIGDGDVGAALAALLPRMLTFALSFAVIGRYWVLHHGALSRMARVDGRLLALNLVFLFCVVFLPFPTSLLGEHGDSTPAVALYAGNLIVAASTSTLLWAYAVRHDLTVSAERSSTALRAKVVNGLAAVVAFVPSLPLAFVSPTWAKVSWLLLIPLSALAGRLFPTRD